MTREEARGILEKRKTAVDRTNTSISREEAGSILANRRAREEEERRREAETRRQEAEAKAAAEEQRRIDIIQSAYGRGAGDTTNGDRRAFVGNLGGRQQQYEADRPTPVISANNYVKANAPYKMPEDLRQRAYNEIAEEQKRYERYFGGQTQDVQPPTILPSEQKIAEELRADDQAILNARRRRTAEMRADERIDAAIAETDESRKVASRDGAGAIKHGDLTVDVAERYMRSQSNSALASWYLNKADESDKEGLRKVMEYDPDMTERYVEQRLKPKFEAYQAAEEQKKMEAAYERVKDIEETENGLFRAIKEGWLALQSGVASGVTGIGNALSWNNDNASYTATSELANQANLRRREQDGDGTFLLQAINAIGNQLPAVAAGAVTGGLGTTVLGMQSFGNGFKQAMADGADKGEAFLMGTLSAGLEIGLSKALGGIEAFGGNTKLVSTISDTINKTMAKIPRNLVTKPLIKAALTVGRSAPEFIEEALQSVLEPITANLVYDKEIDWASLPEDMLRDGLLGIVSASVFNLANNPAARAQRTAELRVTPIEQSDAIMMLPKSLAQAISAAERNGSISDKLARRVGGDISAQTALDVLRPNETLGITQDTLNIIKNEVGKYVKDNSLPHEWRVAYLLKENPNITKKNADKIASDNTAYNLYNELRVVSEQVVPKETRSVILKVLSGQQISGNEANKILDNETALKLAQNYLGVNLGKSASKSEKRSVLVKAVSTHKPKVDVSPSQSKTNAKQSNSYVLNAPVATTDMWKTEFASGNKQNIVYSLTEITNAAGKIFGVKPRTDNNMRTEDESPAEFNEFTGEINMRKANDLPSFIHELGHMLDNRVHFTENASDTVKNETLSNFKHKNKYSEDEWLKEGFAEFTRQFMTNPEIAAKSYPQTYAFVTNNLDGSMKKALVDKLIPAINRYLSASELDRARAATKAEKDKILAPKIAQKWSPAMRVWEWYDSNVGTFKEKFVVNWLDDLYGIEKAARITGKDDLMMWYKTASNSRLTIKGRIKAAITKGLTNIDGEVIGRSLESCFEPIESAVSKRSDRNKTYDDFNTYLVELRARDILSRKDESKRKTVYGDPTINTAESSARKIADLEALHPEFIEAAKRIHEYLDTLLEMRVKSGLISAKQAAAYRAANPHYVPYYREGVTGTDTTKEMVGSTRDFQGVVQSIMLETANVIRATTVNDIKRGVFETITAEKDMAWFVARNNSTPQEFDLSMEENDAKTGLSSLEAYSRPVPNTEKDMGVWVDGKRVSYRINDKAFYTAVVSLTPNTVKPVAKVIRSLNRIFTATVTGLNLPWNVTSNLFRDVQTLLQNSDDWKELVKNAKNYGKAVALSFKGMEKQSSDMQKFYLLGGKGGISTLTKDFSNDIHERKIRKYLNQQSQPNAVKILRAVIHPIDTISRFSDAIESKPRIAAYLTALEKGKSVQEAFFEAQDITTNFARRGASMSKNGGLATATSFIPFFNAGIQGLSKSYRFTTGHNYDVNNKRGQKALWHNVKSATMAVVFSSFEAIVGAKLLSGDEEKEEARKAWNNLSTYHKNNSWCFYIGDGEFFTIKKPRELGILPSFVGRVIGTTFLNDEEAFYDFLPYAAEQLLPPLLDTLPLFVESVITGENNGQEIVGGVLSSFGFAGNLLSALANLDYRGNEIVPSSMSELPTEEQYKNTTTWLAKQLNNILPGISPLQIDYALKNFGILQSISEAFLTEGEEGFGDRLVDFAFRDSMVKDSTYSTDVTTRFYDERRKATAQAKSKNATVEDIVLSKEYDDMAKIYSAFNNLRKEEPKTETITALSNTMLDMMREFSSQSNSGQYNEVVQLLHELSADIDEYNKNRKKGENEIGVTSFYPSVMPTVFEENGEETKLGAEQYMSYQTAYQGYYYDALTEIFATDRTPQAYVKLINKAKERAKKQADNYIREILNGGK